MAAGGEWEKARVVQSIREERIIVVIRTPTEATARKLVEAVTAGGLGLIEVTLTTPGATKIIGDLSGRSDLCVGAGTVMDEKAARDVIDAGARFIISPHADPATIAACRELDVTVIPGTLTPSEVARAWSLGPDFVKVFPIATAGGARYLRTIRGPLPDIPIIPTGGIQREDVEDLFRAGAVAVGVSDGLATTDDVRDGLWDRITDRAKALLDTVRATP